MLGPMPMESGRDGLCDGGGRASSDLELGLNGSAMGSLHHRSFCLSSSEIQFRMPDYGKKLHRAPELKQDEFPRSKAFGRTPPNVLRASDNQNSSICFEHQPDAIDTEQNATPGILRPEENQNTVGRCRHYDNRFHNIIDMQYSDACRNDSNVSEDLATLVGSPLSRKAFHQDSSDVSRHSVSSSSSYSSQTSEGDEPVSTRQLIRYYTNDGNEIGNGAHTSRYKRPPVICYPWRLKEYANQHKVPVQTATERSRQGSLPPPYQQPSPDAHRVSQSHCNPIKAFRLKQLKCARNRSSSKDTVERKFLILKLCKAFMLFGIQAHRLEEYLHITAAYLDVTAEFQYIPHCMLVVLTNSDSETNEVHLLKESTSVDLGKLEDVYHIYEAIIEKDQDRHLSIRQLDNIIRRRKTYTNILLVFLHGLAALCAGTFAFSARPIDFGPLFTFGCLLAILQLLILRTPIRNSHILEVLTCVIVAFAARGLGSIYIESGKPLFCFSGITQGTVALILPGHVILAAIHEIQNHKILSGSVKMVYAILYTLFLGFGILVGTSLFGFVDHYATSQTTCELPWYWSTSPERWRATYSQFVFVPFFALAISVMHQAKRKHLPAMVVIATCGHQAFYWSLARFAQNLQFAGMIAAFANGILANIYAYFSGCLAATILLPAILVIIPNALTASGSLVASVDTADSIVTNKVLHLTEGLLSGVYQKRDFEAEGPSGSTGRIVTAGFGMAQATIGITVGLFLSAFVTWPFTRRRTSFLAF